jgi:hypothetical protein
MQVSTDFDLAVSVIVHKLADVQAGVKSELSDASTLFDDHIHLLIDTLEYQIGVLSKGAQILTASVQDERPFVEVKLDILLASHDVVDYKLDQLGVMQKTLNDKLDAQAKLFTERFTRIVCCLFAVMFMQILCGMQNACHMQRVMQFAAVPRETPTWVVTERSEIEFLCDGIVYLCTWIYSVW